MKKGPKRLILTIDYELFFGNSTGTVGNCMIYPTEKLMEICEKYDSTMTVFWDILHFHRLIELEDEHVELKQDKILIEDQIRKLVAKGHDIQLHIHPHWLDSKYESGNWSFEYDRFSLHDLSIDDDKDDINTIAGCVKYCKELVESIVKEVDPSHEVNTIRAGGYLIEPFDQLSSVLLENNICVDSSVCPGRVVKKGQFSYNFKGYPRAVRYSFSHSPEIQKENGPFEEIPIHTVYIPGFRNLWFQWKKRRDHSANQRFGDGKGNTTLVKERSRIDRKLRKLISSEFSQLTTDNCSAEKYIYLVKKSKNDAVQILHPKLLNNTGIKIMEEQLSNGRIKFASIKEFLSTSTS